MLAYANPENPKDELQRADGFGIARFNKAAKSVTFEAWPRFANVDEGAQTQFPGWPITISADQNDGRKPLGYLPKIIVKGLDRPVCQLRNAETQEVIYTFRSDSPELLLPVYAPGSYVVAIGRDTPESDQLKIRFDGKNSDRAPVTINYLDK